MILFFSWYYSYSYSFSTSTSGSTSTSRLWGGKQRPVKDIASGRPIQENRRIRCRRAPRGAFTHAATHAGGSRARYFRIALSSLRWGGASPSLYQWGSPSVRGALETRPQVRVFEIGG